MSRFKNILVTGGAGYIGSHVCVELLAQGYDVVVLDNLSNSTPVALDRVREIAGRSLTFIEADLCDLASLVNIFEDGDFDAVMHFAGLKAVGESVAQPLRYYDNNIGGSLNLLRCMQEAGVTDLVFSSSATVYGDPLRNPIDEDFPLGATNPYGRTKQQIEEILRDLCYSSERWNVSILRYFNPVGAHSSGLIGEDPADIPNNLMPFVAQTASGLREQVAIFGNDYDTHDGTGVRDYIHVVDLAKGHLKALQKLEQDPGCITHNLGTGQGYSVLEMVAAFEKACGKTLPYQIVERRPGDIAQCYADPSRASRELDWSAEKNLEDMCADAWNWQRKNPKGYR